MLVITILTLDMQTFQQWLSTYLGRGLCGANGQVKGFKTIVFAFLESVTDVHMKY